MEIQIIGMIIFFLVIIVVGIGIVTSFTSLKTLVPSQIKDVYNKVVTAIGFKSPFNICESLSDQKISLQDFQTLLQAIYNGQCGSSHANVSLSFSLTKADLQRIAALDGIAFNGKLIFYNISSPLGAGAIIVQGDPGQYPLKFEDFVDMSRVGSPIGDVFIKVTLKGCDPYDGICDATCVFKKICDPICDDGNKHNIPCNLACIDTNGNNTVDIQDAQQRISQNKCNPDCYVNYTNPFKAYDPGCVWRFRNQNDDVCDPNSNGVYDGICDPDCVKTKNICDPDCNGTIYEGNPYGLNDAKCFVCDGTCNGWCSPSCKKNAFPGDNGYDPDCFRFVNSSFYCSGDGLCESDRGESCANSIDCPGGGLTCGDYHAVCCPTASDADVSGCSITINVSEGGICACGAQCAGNETCDKTSHCCPSGKVWNGTACSSVCPQRIANPSCGSTSQPWSPQTIRFAYDIEPFIKAGFDGSGQTIAIIDACGDPSIVTDVNTFNQKFGLPTIKLNIIGQQENCQGWDGETALDVEWAHAIAPGATIYLIAVSSSETGLGSGVEYVVNNLPGAIVSMSFADSSDRDRYESLFNAGVQKGITFIAADGDWCAYNNGQPQYQAQLGRVNYPAAFTNVLAISGTQNLVVNSKCQYVSETAWNCAGGWGTGGNPGDKSQPAYQQPVSAITDGKRGYGDVSLVSGDVLPVVIGGSWQGIGGTSDASPQWAGIIAVLRSTGIKNLQGNINPIIYKIGTDSNLAKKAFHDITSGNNGLPAQQGWDYPTGFGTPDVVGLCEVLQ
jgi:hypothetical protein